MKGFTKGALAALCLLAGGAAFAASGGGHGGHDEHHEPVPTGAELAERCADYAETLAFTREQLKRRNILGRWNLFKSAHRERERFYDAYCRDDGHGAGHGGDDHGGGGGHGAAQR